MNTLKLPEPGPWRSRRHLSPLLMENWASLLWFLYPQGQEGEKRGHKMVAHEWHQPQIHSERPSQKSEDSLVSGQYLQIRPFYWTSRYLHLRSKQKLLHPRPILRQSPEPHSCASLTLAASTSLAPPAVHCLLCWPPWPLEASELLLCWRHLKPGCKLIWGKQNKWMPSGGG